ncbi:hypothetical protein AYO52_12950 [Dietzia sp. 111N12-1]|nr:hypothetical protein AYO52_12950 [Dietzia sp. 111N12-1]
MREQSDPEAAANQFTDSGELGYLECDVRRVARFSAPGLGQLAEVVAGWVGDERFVLQVCEPDVFQRCEGVIIGDRDVDLLGADAHVPEPFGRGDDDCQVEITREKIRAQRRSVCLLEENLDAGMVVPEFGK